MNREPNPQASPWFARLGVDVRRGEAALCLLLFALHFLLLAFQYAGKSLRQSTFIDSLGAEQLPIVFLLVAVLSYPALLLYGRLVRRVRLDRLLATFSLLAAAGLLGFGAWFRLADDPRPASIAFYLFTALVAILMVSLFWSLASRVLDPRQARRLFGFVGAGGLLGSIAGGQLARLGSEWAGVAGAFALAAAALVLAAGIVWVWGGRHGRELGLGVDAARDPDRSRLRDAKGGFDLIGRGHGLYLRLLAVLVLLAATVAQIVDLQFGWAVERATSTLGERTAIYGNLYSLMGCAAFVFQLVVTSHIHRRHGVGRALRVLPITNGLGAAAFLAAAFFAPALVLPVLWALKATENGLRYSLDQATRELLFVPLPATERARAKAFVDVFVQRAAKGLAAVLLLSVTFGWLSVVATAWIALGCVVLWLAIVGAICRRYVATFRDDLESRVERGDSSRIDLDKAGALEILVAGLGSADPREVRHAIDLLQANGRGHLVPPVMLAHDDPEVRLATLRVLRLGARCEAVTWVERLLADPEAPVRTAAIRTLAALSSDDLREPMRRRMSDPDPKVRAVALSYLAAVDDPALGPGGEPLESEVDRSFSAMVADPDPKVRREAARAFGEIDDPRYQAGVVQLLYDPDESVARAAFGAVKARVERRGPNPLYVPILVSRLHRRRLKQAAREALVAHGPQVVPALRHFLTDRHESIWVRRALPKTIARIGGPAAKDALIGALDADDCFQRRKVIEALATLCKDPEDGPSRQQIEDRIAAECRDALRARLDLDVLSDAERAVAAGERTAHLLEKMLHSRSRRSVERVFGLLGLLHPAREVRLARRGLESVQAGLRATALEYLDNVLEGEVRQQVFAIIDDLPVTERHRRAQRLFGLAPDDLDRTLERHVIQRAKGDADVAWLTAAALHYIHHHRLDHLEHLVHRAAARDEEALVQETAAVLLRDRGPAGQGADRVV